MNGQKPMEIACKTVQCQLGKIVSIHLASIYVCNNHSMDGQKSVTKIACKTVQRQLLVNLSILNTAFLVFVCPPIYRQKLGEKGREVHPSLKQVRTSLFFKCGPPGNSSLEICESEFFKTLLKYGRGRYLIQHTWYGIKYSRVHDQLE